MWFFFIKLYIPKIIISGKVVGLHQYILTEQGKKTKTYLYLEWATTSPLSCSRCTGLPKPRP